jgi:ABC-type dipeptide/oligopeptide/nickel transport system permease subunit
VWVLWRYLLPYLLVLRWAFSAAITGRVDAFIRYLIDVVWSLPTLLVVIALTLALGKGFWQRLPLV